jgi:hypothetical protein
METTDISVGEAGVWNEIPNLLDTVGINEQSNAVRK